MNSRIAGMFGRNTVASVITFTLDLAILYILVEWAGLPRIPAAVVAFLLPATVFYVLLRKWVFPDTQREVAAGFAYSLVNLGIGFAAMLAVFWALLELTPLHYLVARVIASMVHGIVTFLLNGIFNFKQI